MQIQWIKVERKKGDHSWPRRPCRTRQTDRQTNRYKQRGRQASKQTDSWSAWAEGDVGAGVRPQPVIYNLSAQLGQDPADRVGEDWQIRRFGRHFEYWFSSLRLRVCLGFLLLLLLLHLDSFHPFLTHHTLSQAGRQVGTPFPTLSFSCSKSLTPHLPYTLTHSFSYSLTHSLIFSLIHSFPASPLSLSPPSIHPLIFLLPASLTPSIHSLKYYWKES